jgi:NAD(P)-dependent dehydrogenase (short-subunit alcohol dehydrogenase family)
VEGLGESALGRDEVHVTLHPSSQRLAWLVLGSQNRPSVCAGIDFTTEDGRDEVGALRKVTVNSPDADASLLSDLSDRSFHSRGCEHRHGRLEQRIVVALCVGAHAPIRAAKEVGPDAYALQLDVTDQASITAAAERVRNEFGRLDVLVQNAAISNTRKLPGQSVEAYAKMTRPSNVSLDEMRAVWDTNVFGVLAVYQAMLPLLREAPHARIVNVSAALAR